MSLEIFKTNNLCSKFYISVFHYKNWFIINTKKKKNNTCDIIQVGSIQWRVFWHHQYFIWKSSKYQNLNIQIQIHEQNILAITVTYCSKYKTGNYIKYIYRKSHVEVTIRSDQIQFNYGMTNRLGLHKVEFNERFNYLYTIIVHLCITIVCQLKKEKYTCFL